MSEPKVPNGSGDPSSEGGGGAAPGDERDPELLALAEALRKDRDPIAALLRPLDGAAADRAVSRALEAARAGRNGAEKAEGVKVVALPRRAPAPRWVLLAAAAMVGLAAAAALTIGRPRAVDRTAYSLEVKGDADQRGDDPASASRPVRLRPATRLSIRLTPQKPARDKSVRVLLVREGKARLLDRVAHAVTPDGAIVIEGPAREVLGDQPDGPAELVLVVGRAVPDDEALLRIAPDRSYQPDADFDVERRALVLEDWGATRRGGGEGGVLFAGCDAVLAGPACEVAPAAKLRFWVSGTALDVTVKIDDRPAAPAREAADGGARLSIEVPAGAREISLIDMTGAPLLRLPLRPAASAPALAEARRAMQENKLDEAEARLAAIEGQPDLALAALRLRARIARRRGGGAAMKDLFAQAIERAHAAGRTSDEAEDRQLLAYHAMVREVDLSAARRGLADTLALEAGCPECRVDGAYSRGLLAGEEGRLDEALRWLRASMRDADRLGLGAQLAAAQNQLIDALTTLGRHREARALLAVSLKDAGASADPCSRARLTTSAASALTRAADGPESAALAESTAIEAEALARARCPADHAGTLVNLGFAEVATGHVDRAAAHLAEARRAALPGDERAAAWIEALAVEIDLKLHPEAALAAAAALDRRSGSAASPELAFRAASGRARALDALGRAPEAREALDEAERALDRWSARMPLGEGRKSFFEAQARWARFAVDAQVRAAEAEPPGSAARAEAVRRAAALARRSEARFFDASAGAERDDPDARADRAASPGAPTDTRAAAPGTVVLTFHPIEQGWAGFAEIAGGDAILARLGALDASSLQGSPSSPPDPALARVLLDPFAAAIEHAETLRVPALGPLRTIAFEALPFRGRPLSSIVNIVYGFAAGPASTPSPPANAPRRALLVTDPREDLRGAATSGPKVSAALGERGYHVTWLKGAAARREALLNALGDPATALFHYDGHARFEGRDGLRAALDLGDAPLTVADVLALPHVPDTVVLLGCATARDDGMGLSQAFLTRGAQQVLASVDDVPDDLSRQIAERLYAGASPNESTPSLAPLLRSATAPLRDAPTWLFRVLVR
ncbi:MAG: CHAT domain-containing protein [Byssovorax sp.]